LGTLCQDICDPRRLEHAPDLGLGAENEHDAAIGLALRARPPAART
jgi:hypothetical protein